MRASGIVLLQKRNRSDEGVAAAIGLEAAVDERDDRLPRLKHSAVRQRQGIRAGIRRARFGIHTVVDHADALAPE